MLDITDQIIADLEQQIYELKCEIRELKAKPAEVKEVSVAGLTHLQGASVTLEEYQRVCNLYKELLDETLPF